MSALPKIAYILSPSYSGSTLLSTLLARHPEIASIGELKASALGDVNQYHCGCGKLLSDCSFWQKVIAGVRVMAPEFDLSDFGTHFNRGPRNFRRSIRVGLRAPLLQSVGDFAIAAIPSWKSRMRNILDRNDQLIQVVTELQNGRIFLDGSKDPERLRIFLREWGDRMKVIYLIRDGRGVSNSYMKHYEVGMQTASREWITTIKACERVYRSVPEANRISLRYEDLCLETETSMDQIYQLLGLKRSSSNGNEPLHILGNAMRLKGENSITLDEKWRRELSQQDVALFDEVCGPWNFRLGYQ